VSHLDMHRRRAQEFCNSLNQSLAPAAQFAHMRREVNRGGLHMLYEMILLASMMEFAQAMKACPSK
jgi:hypothetical protein